jgi:hypothetical protein
MNNRCERHLLRLAANCVVALAAAVVACTFSLASPTNFIVPDDTALRIRLDDTLTSTDAQVGDPFSATVVDQGEYQSARVYGHVAEIDMSGKVKGRTSMMLRFDRLVMPDGRRAPIHAEIVELYDAPSGEKVDVEGAIESGSRGRSRRATGWNLRRGQGRRDWFDCGRCWRARHHRLSRPSEDHAQQWSGDDDPHHGSLTLPVTRRGVLAMYTWCGSCTVTRFGEQAASAAGCQGPVECYESSLCGVRHSQ